MSLNKFMHPRNRYKLARPSFEALGQKYPEFKMHLVENAKGKPALDFQNPEALRVLTICMMKEDYGLKIELPPDRLVPTLPLRLNYVHWIEDLTKDWNKKELKAIDIGTGACCVYPVLAISANTWQFLATEADEVNFSYAVKNMEENKLTKRIKVVKVSTDIILEGVIGQTEDAYDFCMCNPPFFADHFEAQGLVSRSPSRPDAKTMSTASPQECIVQGGEVAFVRRMIEESNFLQERVRVYTTMLGKKSSVAPLKEILRRHKITNFATTEFCQGKTMRWGLAWSFDKSVSFPKSLFSQVKKEGKKSVVHIIPTQVGGRREPVYDLVIFFKQIFSEMKIHFREGKQAKHFSLLTLTAAENTWIHSRRKRRQMLKESPTKSATVTSESSSQPPSASQSAMTTSAVDSVKDDSESAMTTSAVDSVKDDSESAMTASAIQDACTSVEADRRPAACSMAVEERRHKAEHHNGSASTTSTLVDGTDTDKDQDQELHGTAMQSDPSADGESHKRKSVAVQSSDSPPTKRVKLDTCAPSSDTSSDTKCHKMNSDAEVVESSDSSPPKSSTTECAEAQSSEAGASEETCSAAQSSSGATGPSAGEETDCCGAHTPSKERGEGGGKGKDRPPAQFVLKCHMGVRVQGSDLAVELTWLDGQDIQLMHQLMQVFKNRLTQRE